MPGSSPLVALERVLGLTALNSAALTSSANGDIYYAAGCVVVRYNPQSNRQLGFYTTVKSVTCAVVSPCGKYLAVGERGHQPCICIFAIDSNKMMRRLAGHRHGVGCVTFSPCSKYLVSCGFKHDKQCLFWDWNSEIAPPPNNPSSGSNNNKDRTAPSIITPLFANKIGNKVNAVDFHESGNYFVTCGEKHFKFWYVEYDTISDSDSTITVTKVTGKPALISKNLETAHFMDVVCGKGNILGSSIYACTADGTLCTFHSSRSIDTWINLSSTAYTLTLFTQGHGLLLVGCSDGVIRAFKPQSLTYEATLPLPAPIHANSSDLEYPACYALTSIKGSSTHPAPKVAAVYSDRSLFVWDLSDIKAVAQYRTFSFHRACVWDIGFVDKRDNKTSSTNRNRNTSSDISLPERSNLPPGSFATCSADGTIRLWNLDPANQRSSLYKSPYSREMLHIIDLDDNVTSSYDSSPGDVSSDALYSPNNSPIRKGRNNNSVEGNTISNELAANLDDSHILDLSNGIPNTELPHRPQELLAPRAMAIHPCGTQLACGDKRGRLRVYDLNTMKLIHSVKSHAAEILALHYSPPRKEAGDGTWVVDFSAAINPLKSSNDSDPLTLLASAGRDRLVHIYDVTRSYKPVTTLDNHSSSITALKFTYDGKRLISCGGDKTMVLSSVVGTNIQRIKAVQTPHGTVNGLALEPTNKFAITSGQDKRLNVWNINSGKHMRTYKSPAIQQELYKADVDPSGMFVACSAFDKTLNLFDFFSGELLAQVTGHSEVVTGVRFSLDGRHIISIGGDGCIMVWKLSDSLVTAMQDRLVELYGEAVQKQASILRRSESNLRKALERDQLKMVVNGGNSKINNTDVLPLAPQSSTATAADLDTKGSSATPPIPPVSDVEGGSKWADRLNAQQKHQQSTPMEFTNVVDPSQVNLSISTDTIGSSVAGNIVQTVPSASSPSIEGASSSMARTIEADDGVLCGSDSDLSDDDDDDGEALFSSERVFTPSPPPSNGDKIRESVVDPDGDTASDDDASSQDGSYTKKNVLRESLEESAKLDIKARGHEDKTQEALERLEQSASDLESWLEAKLKNDSNIDKSAIPSHNIPVDTKVMNKRTEAYIVVDDKNNMVEYGDSLNGINDDSQLMSKSLTAAFFQAERLQSDESVIELVTETSTNIDSSPVTSETSATISKSTDASIKIMSTGSEADAVTSESVAGGGGYGNQQKRSGTSLETKRRETSAVLANMKHQLYGMGLYEGTLGATNAKVTYDMDDAVAPGITDGDNNTPPAAIVMPPSPPRMQGFKFNASIDHMRGKLASNVTNDEQISHDNNENNEDIAQTSDMTSPTQGIALTSNKDSNKGGFNFSLTADESINATNDSKEDDDASVASTVTVDATPDSIDQDTNDTGRGSLDFSLSAGNEVVTPISPTTNTDHNENLNNESIDGVIGEEIAVLVPWDGDVTSTEAEAAMARTEVLQQKSATAEVVSDDVNVVVTKKEQKENRLSESDIAPERTMSPTHATIANNITPSISAASVNLPSQDELRYKLEQHANVLAQLNAAKQAAMNSYNDLLGLRGNLLDVSSSFSSQQSINTAPIHISGLNQNSAWTRLQDAEEALGVTDSIISDFRQSFAQVPISGTMYNNLKNSPTIAEDSSSTATGTISNSSISSSTSTSLNNNEERSHSSSSGRAMDSTLDIDKILDSHSDKIMEKLLAKLAAANPNLNV